ncbi:MAG: RNA methyltransferase [Phycisphaeraceae bacterium]|nr:MAG: RNA methyltransferase [Phycisphaeraceae bacterium]
MVIVAPIEDPDDPRLGPFRDLRAGVGPDAGRGFVVEGEIVVRQLAASPYPIRAMLVSEAKRESLAGVIGGLDEEAMVFVAGRAVVDAVVGFAFHRGVMAFASRTPREPWPGVERAPLVLAAETVSNFDNLGGLFRVLSALAPEGSAMLLGPGCADPLYRKVVRVSMGHALRVPVHHAGAWPGALDGLREAGFEVAALTPGAGSRDLSGWCPPPGGRVVVVVGAEGPGLSAGALDRATVRLRVPMRGGVDSLNVVTAAAIALHRLGGV